MRAPAPYPLLCAPQGGQVGQLRLLPAFPALPERFRSFTELKRGEFEVMGFGGLDPAEKELQFDLTEVLI